MTGAPGVRGEEPESAEEAAEVLREAAGTSRAVRFRGGGTKLEWGGSTEEPGVDLSTRRLDRILEHNAADLTAVLEAGVRLAEAQAAFAGAGQMLALDPPLGPAEAATVGGVVATSDSGPLRHRYGAARDLLLGMTVALSDGTVARSGGRVIKNVAGYDLAKLFAGSFGTLGLIVQVVVRLHPRPPARATAVGSSGDPAVVQRGAQALAAAPLEAEALDVSWNDGRGTVLALMAGATAGQRAARAAALMAEAGLDSQIAEDDRGGLALWDHQRGGQRSRRAAVVRVSALPADLERVLRAAAGVGASATGRAGLGVCWLVLPEGGTEDTVGAIEDLRRSLAPYPCAVLDAPREVREKLDPWAEADGPTLQLMRRLKARFDPAGVCNPGLFVGGI